MANWISCTPLDGSSLLFVNLDNVVSVTGNNNGSVIRSAAGEMVVADRPEVIMAKRDEAYAERS